MVDFDDPSWHDSDLSAEYGEIKAYHRSWGDSDDPGSHMRELESRQCTDEEKSGNSKFFHVDPSTSIDLDTYGSKLMCIDENLEIYGSYNSVKA